MEAAGYLKFLRTTDSDSLIARIQFADPRSLFFIVERIRAMFDLNADWMDIAQTLEDRSCAREYIDAAPGLRVPGSWDGFELAIRAIVGQQITVKGATTLTGRIAKMFGKAIFCRGRSYPLFPYPGSSGGSRPHARGLDESACSDIQALARAVYDRKSASTESLDSEVFWRTPREIPGIGAWTAQYIAMRALGEPDAFPVGDIALVRALRLTNVRRT